MCVCVCVRERERDILLQVIKPAELIPRLLWEPWSRISMRIVQTNSTGQQEPPLTVLNLVLVFEQIDAKNKGKEKLLCVKGIMGE